MGKLKGNYNQTLNACYLGYITQAIVNNFAPLLFLTFQRSYGIALDRIALLVSVNFAVQLAVDFLSAKFVDRIGCRICVVGAHIFSAAGLVGLAVFPEIAPSPYAGLLAAVVLYAVGGGLIEVLVSPIVEACPTERKEAAMSLLHSFYCWGHVFVVLASTLYFAAAGVGNWRYLAVLWALLPAANAVYFTQVPLKTAEGESGGLPIRKLVRSRLFWILFLLMVCAGASEQGMSQWASAFAEAGLGVSKTVGDLMGPCFFAVLMGCSRVFYAKMSEKVDLARFMTYSSILCVCSYLLASFAPSPVLSLTGCGLCGLSVGIMWPGTFSVSAKEIPRGGTAMFALLALGGDLGCGGGPAVVGAATEYTGGNLKRGVLAAICFPILMIAGIFLLKSDRARRE